MHCTTPVLWNKKWIDPFTGYPQTRNPTTIVNAEDQRSPHFITGIYNIKRGQNKFDNLKSSKRKEICHYTSLCNFSHSSLIAFTVWTGIVSGRGRTGRRYTTKRQKYQQNYRNGDGSGEAQRYLEPLPRTAALKIEGHPIT